MGSNYYSSFICDLFYKLCNDEEKKSLITFINNNSKTFDLIYKNIDIKNNRIPLCLYKMISSKENSDSNEKIVNKNIINDENK